MTDLNNDIGELSIDELDVVSASMGFVHPGPGPHGTGGDTLSYSLQ